MIQHDPRNKLAIAHMALYSIAHDRCIDDYSIANGLREIYNFRDFLRNIEYLHPQVSSLINLLMPGQKILEVYNRGESSIKEVVETALDDFNEATSVIGEILNKSQFLG